ncbi:hypothetical protein GA0070214_103442 [Micromonospora chaiyaphumensis]|uniref:Uncharacterized protein n=1 Tax=Micromonospora chaiyaphumensis TaxID=307119 RepID=A0A1C4WCX8_9ACTN|nr:hypothetical protein GA0070214_103442 [Micromonospora chaiyaphumensis]
MTRLLDRLLGMAAGTRTAYAGCAPDSWTEPTCSQQNGWSARCTRTCSINLACTVRCGAEYSCVCSPNPC